MDTGDVESGVLPTTCNMGFKQPELEATRAQRSNALSTSSGDMFERKHKWISRHCICMGLEYSALS